MSLDVQKPSETPSRGGSAGCDIPGDFVLVEHAPDGGQESRQLFSELGMALGHLGKRHELFADQVIESTLRAKAALDPLCRPALLDPDLLKLHAETIALETRGAQSACPAALVTRRQRCPPPPTWPRPIGMPADVVRALQVGRNRVPVPFFGTKRPPSAVELQGETR
jgi:hypothetical protein